MLVDDIRSLPKRWSTRIAGLQITSVLAFWALVPPEWRAAVPNWFMFGMVIFFGCTFIAAQSVQQKSLNKDKEEKDGA